MSDQNLAHMFFNRADKFKSKTYVMFKKDGAWKSLTWSEAAETIRIYTLGLIALGMKPGEKLSLLSENRPEWAFTDIATLAAGGVLVTIYPTNTPAQVQYIVDNSDSRFIVLSDPGQLEKVLAESERMPKLEHIISFDEKADAAKDPRVKTLGQVIELGKSYAHPEEFARRLTQRTMDDVATLIYTSGTTGDPKGVQLTHGNLYTNVSTGARLIDINETDVALSFLPLSHSFERSVGHFAAIFAGITVAYAESIPALPQNLAEIRPTMLVSVPRIYEKVHAKIMDTVESGPPAKKKLFFWALGIGREALAYRLKNQPMPLMLGIRHALADKLVFSKMKQKLGGRIRYCASGGAPLAPELCEFFNSIGVMILEGYGLTETSPVIAMNSPQAMRIGTVGKPLPGVDVKIAEDGEILCKGPNVMVGYYKREEDTAEALEGGWFHTGDIGEFDEEGFLRITDRKKDLIITAGGKNIAPQNIENLLKLEKYIEQVNVVGDRRQYLTAIIVPSFEELSDYAKAQKIPFDSTTDLIRNERIVGLIQEAVDRVNARLAKYETIKKFILSDVDFNQDNNMLTPTLKVKRKVVNQVFADGIKRMYGE